ncbi:MAG: glycosyltransferase family 2 protein [Deltaproteobacteria bacterium]|nr:glycosyltransferase family 2 protein [Deltaproteobacteria bacterium]
MDRQDIDISFVIVNWNTRKLLDDCIASIESTVKGIRFDIIVVDNASHDDSVAMVMEKHPSVRLIKNSRNLGFGAANNQAFAVMNGRYAILLNTDTVLTEGAVMELFAFMESHTDAAMACGQLLNLDGSKQNSIAPFPTILTLLMNTTILEYLFPRRYPSKRYGHKNPVEIDSGIGACLIVRKEAMNKVGNFDERYFFFFEETDWAYQMKLAGWKIYHVPTALIYHLQGQSIGQNSRSRIEFYRSRYQYFRKWKSAGYNFAVSSIIFLRLMVNWLTTLIATVATLGINRTIRNKCSIYSKIILWHIMGCP